jgi:hypothetical protein
MANRQQLHTIGKLDSNYYSRLRLRDAVAAELTMFTEGQKAKSQAMVSYSGPAFFIGS